MNTVRIGLAGFGTVGSAVYHHLKREANLLFKRCGAHLVVTAIAIRNHRKRRPGLPRALLVPSVEDLAASDRTDLIVEVMGGCNHARKLILSSLRAGKPIVTANKALLAEHGREIFGEANQRKVPVYFEASVAGGIPIIQSLREGLIANRFRLIYGIVNGTCNYILSRMSQEGISFETALHQAQALGYAETDPSLDIDGLDSAHKAAVLASLAHGGWIDFNRVYVEGIRNLSTLDIQFAHQLGYEIKLLAIIRPFGTSNIEVRVHPTLIPKSNRLASIRGATNAIIVRGHVVGDIEFSGPGAGGDATASAILSDVAQAASHLLRSQAYQAKESILRASKNLFSRNSTPSYLETHRPKVASIDHIVSRYYLRLAVTDEPGVMAQVSSILGKSQIGICSVIQPERHESKSVPLIFMVYDARHDTMQRALKKIHQLKCIKAKPIILRVEDFTLLMTH